MLNPRKQLVVINKVLEMGAKGDTWVSIQFFHSPGCLPAVPSSTPADETFSPPLPPRRNYFSLPPSAQEITERPYRSDRKLNGWVGEVVGGGGGQPLRRQPSSLLLCN